MTGATGATPQPVYPLPAPTDTDPRFTYGLLHEVAQESI